MGRSMFKKLILAVALLLPQPLLAAGTINLSLTQQIDKDTQKPLAGGKLYFFQAGTTTPQIAYQDSALTIPLPGGSIYTLDASGRIPQFFLADGQIKIRLVNKAGVTQFAADNLLVIGPSGGGGGGGGSVDPTTVMQTGTLMSFYGIGVRSGFVRINGRTIGNASSGASERANADCQALFEYLWNNDSNLPVSFGRGATANADWVANKTITLPDARGRAIVSLDDMGNTTAGRMTLAPSTTLGGAGGSQTSSIARANLPTDQIPVAITDPGHAHGYTRIITGTINAGSGASVTGVGGSDGGPTSSATTGISALTNALGSGSALNTLSPVIFVTTYIKL